MSECLTWCVQSAVKSNDVYFHHILYGALIDMGLADTLLGLEAPYLETFLAKVGLGGLRAGIDGCNNASGHPHPPCGPVSASI